jgi:hypothetical protein
MVHRAHCAMSGGIDRIRARGPAGGANATPSAKNDGAFASMITPEQAAESPAEAAEAAPGANLSSVAWLQSNVADMFTRSAQDREARRHGRALLQALAGLQRAALEGDGEHTHAALTALARTVEDHHEADDPVLCLILREIAVRAAVELARAETPAPLSPASQP